MDENAVKEFFEEHREDHLETIMELIRIPSVSEPGTEGSFPFGKACANVLEASLALGKKAGFETKNHDYYCGSILMPGEKKGEIGILAHLDVVPPGEGWLHPPFEPYIKDGWLYGRGSTDNKGPAVTALYAMRCIKECGIKLRHDVRLFLGCSEENGMHDIKYYLKHYPAPDFSFTPDASFSVCYSEKGILEAEFTAPLPKALKEFSAGNASNAVAGSAFAVLKTMNTANIDTGNHSDIQLERSEETVTVKATGLSAHAAFPEGAINAGAILAGFLCEQDILDASEQRILFFPAECFSEHFGEKAGIACESEELGRLTAVCGMIRTVDDQLHLNVNIRYPAIVSGDVLADKLRTKAASYGWSCVFVEDDPPMYISPNDPLIKALDNICKEQLGASFEPYTMGGGTYARRLQRAVAYGPGIRGQKKPGPKGHGGGHQPDECVQLQVLENAFYIYVKAILAIDALLP